MSDMQPGRANGVPDPPARRMRGPRHGVQSLALAYAGAGGGARRIRRAGSAWSTETTCYERHPWPPGLMLAVDRKRRHRVLVQDERSRPYAASNIAPPG